MLNVAIENTESPNISYVSFWPVSLLTGGVSNSGHWVNDQPDVYPTGLHVYSNQLVLNRGRPIGPSDCNNDHIQRFIKITNMVKKSPLKKLVHTCGGLVSSGLYWFSHLLNINVPGIL